MTDKQAVIKYIETHGSLCPQEFLGSQEKLKDWISIKGKISATSSIMRRAQDLVRDQNGLPINILKGKTKDNKCIEFFPGANWERRDITSGKQVRKEQIHLSAQPLFRVPPAHHYGN